MVELWNNNIIRALKILNSIIDTIQVPTIGKYEKILGDTNIKVEISNDHFLMCLNEEPDVCISWKIFDRDLTYPLLKFMSSGRYYLCRECYDNIGTSNSVCFECEYEEDINEEKEEL